MSRQVRLYGRLVRLYPARFRQQYAHEMMVLFADQLRDARASGARFAVARLWARSLSDLVVTAPVQYIRREGAMPQTVEAGFVTNEAGERPPRRLMVALALTPVLMWSILAVLIPGFTDPLYQNPPGILGFPAGIAVLFLAGALTVVGSLVAIRTRSTVAFAFAFLFCTLPAIVLMTIGPTVILAIEDLAV